MSIARIPAIQGGLGLCSSCFLDPVVLRSLPINLLKVEKAHAAYLAGILGAGGLIRRRGCEFSRGRHLCMLSQQIVQGLDVAGTQDGDWRHGQIKEVPLDDAGMALSSA